MPRQSRRAAAPRIGLRERNKLEKLERIRAAARALFRRHGYSAATMRQIAHRAHVGLGTLFSYADDKRDLVFLIFNEELDTLTDRALAAPRARDPLLAQLMAIFERHYEQFAQHPALSRLALQELTFYSTGKQAEAFHAIRGRLIAGIERLVAQAQRAGRIRASPDAKFIARQIFFVYSAAVRWWIAAPAPRVAAGLADLRRVLALQIEGLAARPGARRAAARRRTA
ncbi:MAG: TetR/AcrR family transcriptional regulator [Burkholderiales bacterium]|nr:TetR/AcrR family transcriptional regulator [Burkholderiales bacterium]